LPRYFFRSFLILIRINLSAAITFSAFVAWFICAQKVTAGSLVTMAAVFFLASGTSVLNQFQERKVDALMNRTKRRPIPAGDIDAGWALMISFFFILCGVFLFALRSLWIPLSLGIFNIMLYNGIYTPLKKRTTFSLIIGALTGAVPVLMGWTAAGGNILDHRALALALFIFFWQIPHFWLLMLTHSTDYKNAGIPAITDNLSLDQVKRLILIWLFASTLTSLFLILKEFVHPYLSGIPVMILNLAILIVTFFRFFLKKSESFRFLFILVNIFLFAVLCTLLIEKLLF
jgi:heme o synthase